MLSDKNLLVIKSLGLGILFLGLAQTPTTGFSLDLFNEANSDNTADFYSNGNFIGTFPATGQRVSINQSTSGTGLVYSSENTDTGLSTVIGENRHLKVTASNINNVGTLQTETTTSDNLLNLNTDAGVTSTGLVVWNGSSLIDYDNLTTNANLNLDLEKDNDGDDSIGINILFADLGGTLELTLYDGANTHTIAQSIPQVGEFDSSATLSYNFNDYQTAGVNINSVDYISMGLTGPAGSDIQIDFVETAQAIPFEFSPSLGLIISVITIGISQWLRNKHQNKKSF